MGPAETLGGWCIRSREDAGAALACWPSLERGAGRVGMHGWRTLSATITKDGTWAGEDDVIERLA